MLSFFCYFPLSTIFFVHDILECMVQIYLVVNNHHQRIDNPFDEVLVFFLFC